MCDGSVLGSSATRSSGGGFSKGSGFFVGVALPESVGCAFGFLANAGQYRSWNWKRASRRVHA